MVVWSLDHPEVVAEFTDRGVKRVYEEYFAAETVLAASGTVDVLAHVDLVKVFGHRLQSPPTDLYRGVVDAAQRSGTAVEVNTSALDGFAAEVYPGPEFLRMFADAHVPMTLGSDAHRPEDVGSGFDVGRAQARLAGYTERLRFRERMGTPTPL